MVAISFFLMAHMPRLRPDTIEVITAIGFALCFVAFVGCFQALHMRSFGMPQDTKEFLSAISLLECFSVRGDLDGYPRVLGPFKNWPPPRDEGPVREAAKCFLCEAARKIMVIESAKDLIPWRAEAKRREISKARDLFARHHLLLLKFADVPEDWGYYFKR